MSCQPCGCDETLKDRNGYGYICERHRARTDEGEFVTTDSYGPGTVSYVYSPKSTSKIGLPTTDVARKAIPIWDGVIMYFPGVMAAIAEVSKKGNDQHNPGEKLQWAREKSTDQMNTALRHMIDHGTGNVKDTDGTWHLAKAIWRLCAELQLTIEREAK